MDHPPLGDRALRVRLAAAESVAVRQTEATIQRCRVWILPAAVVQTLAVEQDRQWLGWCLFAGLVATTLFVRWALGSQHGRSRSIKWIGEALLDRWANVGRRRQPLDLAAVGAVAMAGDTLVGIGWMANQLASPYSPVGLLPLILIVEAATRWGRGGGLWSGILGGVANATWATAVHVRNQLELPLAYLSFRFVVMALVGAMLGTTVRHARQERRAASAVFNASRDLIATFGPDGTLRSVNPASEDVLGFTPEELMERGDSFLLGVEHLAPEGPGAGLLRVDGPQLVELRVAHRDGHLVWLELDLLPDRADGVIHAIGRDVSGRRRTEAELRHRIDHDGLTGVWNRDAMRSHLEPVISGGGRPGLVFIDLDRFKAVNDDHGHLVGDKVLVAVAHRLRFAAGVDGSVVRYAGDEFCIVVDEPTHVDALADRVRDALLEPIDIGDGRTLTASATIGTAVCEAGETSEGLVDRADQDMYRAKRRLTL